MLQIRFQRCFRFISKQNRTLAGFCSVQNKKDSFKFTSESFRPISSDTRIPVAYKSSSIALSRSSFGLVPCTASISRSTSSGLSTPGSFFSTRGALTSPTHPSSARPPAPDNGKTPESMRYCGKSSQLFSAFLPENGYNHIMPSQSDPLPWSSDTGHAENPPADTDLADRKAPYSGRFLLPYGQYSINDSICASIPLLSLLLTVSVVWNHYIQ